MERAWEKKKVEILHGHSQRWKQVNDLGLFLTAVEASMPESNQRSAQMIEWLRWARKMQKSLNPLADGLDEFLREYEFEGGEE